jgi:hypothetical protein
MGLMSGFIQGAAAEGVKVFGSAMLKELEMQKAKQIAAYSAELADTADLTKRARDVEGEEATYQKGRIRAPEIREQKVADASAAEQAKLDVSFDPTNVQAEAYKRGVLGEADAEVEVAKLLKKSTPEALKAAKDIAAATRDPAQQRLLGLQIAEAALKLDEGKAQATERTEVRGLMGAARAVDAGQPGAEDAKQFYTKQAKEAEKGAQLAKGVDVDKADRATYLALAKEKYELATKEMDPERKDKLIRDGDSYAKAAEGKGETAAAGKPAEAAAHSDAEKAIATGKITRDEANKRLVAAGLAPLAGANPRKPPAKSAGGDKPDAPATQTTAVRIAEIEAQLAAADKNKFTVGSGAQEWVKNRIPPAERVRLERELQELRNSK